MTYIVKRFYQLKAGARPSDKDRFDKTKPPVWAVGVYEPRSDDDGEWANFCALHSFRTVTAAARMCSFLNGGNEPAESLEEFLANELAS